MAADGRRSSRPARDPYAAWYGPDKCEQGALSVVDALKTDLLVDLEAE